LGERFSDISRITVKKKKDIGEEYCAVNVGKV
jgi:hypothetical protein